jgi:hypothetical protein
LMSEIAVAINGIDVASAMVFAPGWLGSFKDSEGGGGRHCLLPLENKRERSVPSLLRPITVIVPQNGSSSCRGSRHAQSRLRGRSYRSPVAPRSVSCFIGEATPLRPDQGGRSAGYFVDAELFAIVLPEIELCEVAVQVRLVSATTPVFDALWAETTKMHGSMLTKSDSALP